MAVSSINLNDTFSDWVTITNTIGSEVGDLTALTTTTSSNLVAAMNEINSDKISLDSANSGYLRGDSADTKTAGNLTFNDNVKANFGTSADLGIYHDGTHSYITDSGTGSLKISASQIDLLGGADGAETMASFVDDGAATFYYDNTKRLETTDSGATITGNFTATGTLSATTSTITSASISAATPLTLTSGASDWTVSISSNNLVFAYGGTNMMELNDSGNLTVIGNITTNGTI